MSSLSEILSPFSGTRLVEWYADLTELWHDTKPIKPEDISSPKGLTQWVHYKNFVVWHFEDKVRHSETTDSEIADIESTIDYHNRKRLEAIEQIDIWISNVLSTAGIEPGEDVDINSETPGSIIDRLSILTLKIFHMAEHLENDKLGKDEKQATSLRLAILEEQRLDLAAALDKLFLDLRQAKKRHKVYRQFKIYNDPSFHPEEFRH